MLQLKDTTTADVAEFSLLKTHFQTQRAQYRLMEIVGVGVGDHVSPNNFSIDQGIWRVDGGLIEEWNALDAETRRGIVKALRREKFQDSDLLERVIASEHPLSVLFSNEEQYHLLAILQSGAGYEYVDCIAWMIRVPESLYQNRSFDYTICMNVQKKWNMLPKDLRMKLRDCIVSPDFHTWKASA